MSVQGRRRGAPELLLLLSVLAVLGHLFGLYRPTGPPSPSWFVHIDKAEHILGFALPVCLILLTRRWYALRNGTGAVPVRFTVLVTGAFAVHAVLSELVQHFFYAHRNGDVFDVLADWTGVALGWAVARLVGWRHDAHRAHPVPALAEGPR